MLLLLYAQCILSPFSVQCHLRFEKVYCSIFMPSQRYEVKDSKLTSPDSELDGASFKIMRGPYDRNNSNTFPGRKLSIEQDEGSGGEMSGYGSKTSKRGSDGRRIASASSHNRGPYGRQVTGGDTKPWTLNSYYESKYLSIALKPSTSTLMEDRQLSGKMAMV